MSSRSLWVAALLGLGLGAGGLLGPGCASDPPPKKEPPKCPRLERDSDTVVEEVLCAQKDSDGDGVDDAVDLCPEGKETPNGTFDGDGCPDPDRDHDLMVDFNDACPDQAGPPPDGCPEADQDGDGLPDHLDGCPSRAEDLDGEDDADGCPEGERRLAAGETLAVWESRSVEMRRSKDQPSDAGARTLALLTDGAAERVGTVVRVRIQATAGLKEVRGGRAADLAEQRGQAVRGAFLAVGIPPSRLEVSTEVLKGKEGKSTGAVQIEIEVAVPAAPGAQGSEGKPTEGKPAEPGAQAPSSSGAGPADAGPDTQAAPSSGSSPAGSSTKEPAPGEPGGGSTSKEPASSEGPPSQAPPGASQEPSTSKDSTSKDSTSKDSTSKDAPSKDAPSKDAPSKDAPSKDAPSKDAAPGDAPPR